MYSYWSLGLFTSIILLCYINHKIYLKNIWNFSIESTIYTQGKSHIYIGNTFLHMLFGLLTWLTPLTDLGLMWTSDPLQNNWHPLSLISSYATAYLSVNWTFSLWCVPLIKSESLNWPWSTKILGQFVTHMCKFIGQSGVKYIMTSPIKTISSVQTHICIMYIFILQKYHI